MGRVQDKNNIIIILIFIIIVSAVGHIEWHNLYLKQTDKIKELTLDNGIYSTSLEQCEETLYKTCQENDRLKAEIERLISEKPKEEVLHYDYIGEFTITAYCCEKYPHICGGGNTASGVPPTPELTCAVADLEMFPFGTIVYIEGIGLRVAQDTGGFDTTKIDVAVETHEEAMKWKTGKHKVWIVEPKGE